MMFDGMQTLAESTYYLLSLVWQLVVAHARKCDVRALREGACVLSHAEQQRDVPHTKETYTVS